MRSALVAALTALALLAAPAAQANPLTPQEQRFVDYIAAYGVNARSGDPLDLVLVGYDICQLVFHGNPLSTVVENLRKLSNTSPGGLSSQQAWQMGSAAIVNLCPKAANLL